MHFKNIENISEQKYYLDIYLYVDAEQMDSVLFGWPKYVIADLGDTVDLTIEGWYLVIDYS